MKPGCAVCARPVKPVGVLTDAPVVCARCYEDEPHADLPRSEPGTVPDLFVRPLAEETPDAIREATTGGQRGTADAGRTNTDDDNGDT